MNNALSQLRKIFSENADKRICVIGASCIGKTTLLRQLPGCLDQDDIVMESLPMEIKKEFKSYSEPWTDEAIEVWKTYVNNCDIKIKPGNPVFGIQIFDCDLLVYLRVDEEEHRSRTAKRGKNFEKIIKHIARIDKAVQESVLPVITVDVSLREVRTYYYVNCFLIRKSDEKMLLSVRADTKEFAPGCYDFSVRGQHWGDAEGILKREIWLQLGIKQKIQHLYSGLKWQREDVKNEAKLFIGYLQDEPTWCNPIEIKELQYKSIAEIQELLKDGKENFIPEFELGFEKLVAFLKERKYRQNIYELAKICDGESMKSKTEILSQLPKPVAENIETKSWVRFFIRNSFHDAVINEFEYDKKAGALNIRVRPIQSFCDAKIAGDVVLTFYSKDLKFADAQKLTKFARKVGIDIYGIEIYLRDDGKVAMTFDLTCHNYTKKSKSIKVASEDWYPSFICENVIVSVQND